MAGRQSTTLTTSHEFRSVASRLLNELASTKLERKQLAVELQGIPTYMIFPATDCIAETKDRLTEKSREADKLKGADAAKTTALAQVERAQGR